MTSKLEMIEKEMQAKLKKDFPPFCVGDTLRVTYSTKEKDGKERRHSVEGIVIKKQNSFHRSSFTIRRISYGENMEITFPFFSPLVVKIEVVQPAKRKPRRAKLYYLRKRIGKKASTV